MEIRPKIDEISNQVSDTYIRHYETEIKFIQEKAKLSLWIVGLSLGMELFLLNKFDKELFGNIFILILFIAVSLIFVVNAIYGLLIRIKQTRLINHLLSVCTMYDYQKTLIFLSNNDSTKLGVRLIEDYESGKINEQIMKLVYQGEQELKEDSLAKQDTSFLLKSDNIPSTLLIIQGVLTVSLFIFFIIIS